MREEEIERHVNDLREIDDLIEMAKKAHPVADTPSFRRPTIRPGKYEGVKPAKAAEMYIKEAGGGLVEIAIMAQDLKRGGCAPEWKRAFEHNLRIILANNPRKFRYSKGSPTVGLVDPA